MNIRKSPARRRLDPGTTPWAAPALYRAVWLAVAVLVLAGAALLFARPGEVFAHADYDRSTPGKSESVPEGPTRLDMYTTQDMFKQEGENELRVFDEAENRVDDGNTVVDDDDRRHLYVGLQPDLPPGRYAVRWKTFSDEDGERFGGAFAFYIGVTPTTEQLHADRELEEQAELEFEQGAEAAATPGAEPPAATSAAEPSPTVKPQSSADEDGDDGAPVGIIVGAILAAVAVVAVVGAGAAINRWRSA